MRVVKVKKIYQGYASVRDYLVKDALARRDGLQILYKEDTMTLEHEDLLMEISQLHKKKFKSKYSGEEYELYDFDFKPDIIIEDVN